MKFLVDTQLPPRLSGFLAKRGHDSIHSTYFADRHLLTDAQIIAIALDQERTVVTKGADFSEFFLLRGAPPRVLLVEFGNIRNQELMDLFDLHLDEVVASFLEGSEMVILSSDEIIAY